MEMAMTRNQALKFAILGALSALALMTSSASLFAQSAATAPTQKPHFAETNRPHSPHSAMEHVEARIAELHNKLRITPDQEPQFKAYADVTRTNAQAMDSLFEEREQSTGTKTAEPADKRLHWYARLTAAHAEAVNKLVPVFDALYQSLSDEQKKTADALFRHELQQRRMPRRDRAHHAR
jgi:periplasmic protein CpxP/Spy